MIQEGNADEMTDSTSSTASIASYVPPAKKKKPLTPFLKQNSIRVALYPDSYPPPDHTHGPEHLDHCLIHLRQHIQCSGDTTPNPTKFYQGINSNYVYGDRIHSCRDWSVIRKWAWERHNGTLKVEREGLKKL